MRYAAVAVQFLLLWYGSHVDHQLLVLYGTVRPPCGATDEEHGCLEQPLHKRRRVKSLS